MNDDEIWRLHFVKQDTECNYNYNLLLSARLRVKLIVSFTIAALNMILFQPTFLHRYIYFSASDVQ